MVERWELRARFAQALSAMYGREVPAYTTLIDVASQVNADVAVNNPSDSERLGSLERVTAERHGAIRLGNPAEMRQAAVLFAGFGMYPVGFYDLREAATAIPVVSTAFRPIEPHELARNPFRVFTSMLTTADRRFFDPGLQTRLESFLATRSVFPTEVLHLAALSAESGGLTEPSAERFVTLAAGIFALSDTPVDRAWYDELERVSPVAADIGAVTSTHINHLTPRVLDIDELYRRMTALGITMIDRIQGPPSWSGPDVLLRQTSFRALAEPRRFVEPDGSITNGELRVRFGEVESRGIALTPRGRALYDRLAGSEAERWEREFPRTEAELEAQQLAYFTYRLEKGQPVAEPIVYEDFLPASAAGIFQSNLDSAGTHSAVDSGTDYDSSWLAESLGRPVHDPFTLYRQQQDRSRRALERTLP